MVIRTNNPIETIKTKNPINSLLVILFYSFINPFSFGNQRTFWSTCQEIKNTLQINKERTTITTTEDLVMYQNDQKHLKMETWLSNISIFFSPNLFHGKRHKTDLSQFLKQLKSELYSSNGSNSIFVSNPSGANPRMQYEYRYMLLSSHIVSLLSLNMILNLADLLLRSCVSWVILCWSKIPYKNFWLPEQMKTRLTTIVSCIWISNLINDF